MSTRKYRLFAALSLLAFVRLVFPEWYHQLEAHEGLAHYWCTEHQRIEHYQPAEKNSGTLPSNSVGQEDFSQQKHDGCPLAWQNFSFQRFVVGFSFLNTIPADPIFLSDALFTGLRVIHFAPKTSPPALSC